MKRTGVNPSRMYPPPIRRFIFYDEAFAVARREFGPDGVRFVRALWEGHTVADASEIVGLPPRIGKEWKRTIWSLAGEPASVGITRDNGTTRVTREEVNETDANMEWNSRPHVLFEAERSAPLFENGEE